MTNVTIQGVPDDMSIDDIAASIRIQLGNDIKVVKIERAQHDKSLRVQATEIRDHIQKRDYGIAQDKAIEMVRQIDEMGIGT